MQASASHSQAPARQNRSTSLDAVLSFLKEGLSAGEHVVWFTGVDGVPELPDWKTWGEAAGRGALRFVSSRNPEQAFAALEREDGPLRIAAGGLSNSRCPAEFRGALFRLLEKRPARLLYHFGDNEEQQLRKACEEAYEELAQFAYVASHDLQEPLRTVNTFLGMLRRNHGEHLDEKSERYIDYAQEGVQRMHQLIQSLLEFSRANRPSNPAEKVDGNRVLENAVDSLQVEIEEARARITCGELPKLVGDPGQLEQVFRNLIKNSLCYRGPSEPRIDIGCERSGDRYVLQVRDNGIGFDMEYGEQIFMPFRRLHTQQDIPGAGLGLSICRKIVRRHGGDMWAKARPGEGATFYFTWPATRPPVV